MPTPREAYTNTVQEQGFTGARVQAPDFGAAGEILGRAAQGFGRDLEGAARDVDDIRSIYAVTAAKDAEMQAAMAASAIVTGYERLNEKDAIAARDTALADLERTEKEYGSQLKDRRAQRMFQEVFSQRRMGLAERIVRHEAEQVELYEDNTSKAREEMSLTLAADSWQDEPTMLQNLATAAGERANRMRGASDDSKLAARMEVMSEGLKRAWTQIQDPIAAELFRQRHSADIDPITERQMISSNAAGLFDSRVDIMWEDVVSGAGASPLVPEEGLATETPDAPRAVTANPVSGRDYNPAGRAGRRGDAAAAHARRGSDNKGIDFPAPAGSPIRPPMPGKVIETGADATRGNFIRVAYDNGLTGVFLHLKTPPPVAEGDPVDPGTIIGAVGSTGRSTGPHVHYSVRDANGNYVDPDTVSYSNDGSRPIPVAGRFRPEDTDTAALFGRIYAYAEENNLTGKETEALLGRANAFANRNQALRQEQENRLADAAMEVASELGENLIKPSQVPNFSELPWQAKDRILAIVERNTAAREPEANGQAITDALVLEIENPEAFLRLNPAAMPITRAEQQAITLKQARLRNPDGSANETALGSHKVINERITTYLSMGGIVTGSIDKPEERREREEMRGFVERQIAARESQTGKKLTFQEIDAIAQDAAVQVTFTRNGRRETGRRYEVSSEDPAVQNATVDRRDRARSALRRANRGIAPTERQIDEFLASRGGR